MAKRGGKPRFVPDEQQRRMVTAMVGTRMTWDQIANVILNPHTGRPINKHTLAKAFKHELANGAELLKAKVLKGFYQLLEAEDEHVRWRVTEWCLKNLFGYRDDQPLVNMAVQNKGVSEFKIGFVMPDGRTLDMDAELLDEPGGWSGRPRDERPTAPLQIEHNKPYQHDSRRILDEGREREKRAATNTPSRARSSTEILDNQMPEGRLSVWDNGAGGNGWLKR